MRAKIDEQCENVEKRKRRKMKSKNGDERTKKRRLLKTMVERTGGASTVPCSVLPVLLLSCSPGGNGSCCSAQNARGVPLDHACSRFAAVLLSFRVCSWYG